jgi:hypothetical protein
MGNLTEMVVRKNGRNRKIKPKKSFVAWIPKGKHLAILKAAKNNPKPKGVSGSVEKLHKKFHKTKSNKSKVYEWPDIEGDLIEVGRIVSLTYTVPKWLRSPGKNGYRWHHEFGDHGERGHGDVRESGNYPQKFMPLLLKDEKGNYYIKRVRGNRYYVTDWLYW